MRVRGADIVGVLSDSLELFDCSLLGDSETLPVPFDLVTEREVLIVLRGVDVPDSDWVSSFENDFEGLLSECDIDSADKVGSDDPL